MEKDSVTQNLDGGSWTLGINLLHWFKYETVAQNEGGGSRTLGVNFLCCFVSEIVRTNEDGGSWTHGINFLDGLNNLGLIGLMIEHQVTYQCHLS